MSYSQTSDTTKISLEPHAHKYIHGKECFCWRAKDQVPEMYKRLRREKINDTIIKTMVKQDSTCLIALEQSEAIINNLEVNKKINNQEVELLKDDVKYYKTRKNLYATTTILVAVLGLVLIILK
jgi:hypothetical protein